MRWAKLFISSKILILIVPILIFPSLSFGVDAWNNPWMLIHTDKSCDIFIDSSSYIVDGNKASFSLIYIDVKLDEPATMQTKPFECKINCKDNAYYLSNKDIELNDFAINEIFVAICDFSKKERLKIYHDHGIKSDNIEAIETFQVDVDMESFIDISEYFSKNTSQTPLPSNELNHELALIEDNIFHMEDPKSVYNCKKILQNSIILESNPNYAGWNVGWIYAGPDEYLDKDSSKYIRIKDFKLEYPIFDFWYLNVHDDMNYILVREKINCKSKKVLIEDMQITKEGKMELVNIPEQFQNWNSPPPNSGQSFLIRDICHEGKRSKDEIFDYLISSLESWKTTIKKEKIKIHKVPKLLFENIE